MTSTPVDQLLPAIELRRPLSATTLDKEESETRRERFSLRMKIALSYMTRWVKSVVAREQKKLGKKIALQILSHETNGPLARSTANVLANEEPVPDRFVDEELLPHHPVSSTDILGRQDFSAKAILELPKLSDEKIRSNLTYIMVLSRSGVAMAHYVGAAAGEFAGVRRWYDYKRASLNLDISAVHNSSLESCLRKLSVNGVQVYLRAVAVEFPRDLYHAGTINEALLIDILNSLFSGVISYSYCTDQACAWYKKRYDTLAL